MEKKTIVLGSCIVVISVHNVIEYAVYYYYVDKWATRDTIYTYDNNVVLCIIPMI